ncbi:MAG: hypothetical protein ACRC41_07925, partial [Sarcina sp.]
MNKSKLSALIALAATGAILATNNIVAKADTNRTDFEKEKKKSIVVESNLLEVNSSSDLRKQDSIPKQTIYLQFIDSKKNEPMKNKRIKVDDEEFIITNQFGEATYLVPQEKDKKIKFEAEGYENSDITLDIGSESAYATVYFEETTKKEEKATMVLELKDNATKKALANKKVSISNSKTGESKIITLNSNGLIEFPIPSGYQKFVIDVDGYEKYVLPLTIKPGNKVEFSIKLQQLEQEEEDETNATKPVNPEIKPTTPVVDSEGKPTIINTDKKLSLLSLKIIDVTTNKPLTNQDIKLSYTDELFTDLTTDQDGELKFKFKPIPNQDVIKLSSPGYKTEYLDISAEPGEHIQKVILLKKLSDVIKPVTPPVDTETKPVTPAITPEINPTNPTIVNPDEKAALVNLKFVDVNTREILSNELIGINDVFGFTTNSDGYLDTLRITSKKHNILDKKDNVMKEFPLSLGKQTVKFSMKGYQDISLSLDIEIGDTLDKYVFLKNLSDVSESVTPPVGPETKPTNPTIVNPDEKAALVNLKFFDTDTREVLPNELIGINDVFGFTTNSKGYLTPLRISSKKHTILDKKDNVTKEFPISLGKQTLKFSAKGYEDLYLSFDINAGDNLFKFINLKKLSDVSEPVTPPIDPETKPINPTIVNPEKQYTSLKLKFIDEETNKTLSSEPVFVNFDETYSSSSITNENGDIEEKLTIFGKQLITVGSLGYKTLTFEVLAEPGKEIQKTIYLSKISDVTRPVKPEIKPITPPITPETKPTNPTTIDADEEFALLTLKFRDVGSNETMFISYLDKCPTPLVTDENGEIKDIKVVPGHYQLKIFSENYGPVVIPITTEPGKKSEETIYMKKFTNSDKEDEEDEESAVLTLNFLDAKTDKLISNRKLLIKGKTSDPKKSLVIGTYLNTDGQFIGIDNYKLLDSQLIVPITLTELKFSIEGYKDKSISLNLSPDEHLEKNIYLEKIENPDENFVFLTLKFIDSSTNKVIEGESFSISSGDKSATTFITNKNGEIVNIQLRPRHDIIEWSSTKYEAAGMPVEAAAGEHLYETLYLHPIKPEIIPETKPPIVKPKEEENAFLALKLIDAKTGKVVTNKILQIIDDQSFTDKPLINIFTIIGDDGKFLGNRYNNEHLKSQIVLPTTLKKLKFLVQGYKEINLSLDLSPNEHLEKTIYLEKIDDVTPPVNPDIKPVTPPITPETKPTNPTVVNPDKEDALLTLKFIDANTNKVLESDKIGINGVYMFYTNQDGLLENLEIKSEKNFGFDRNGELKEFPISLGKQILTISLKGYKDKSISLEISPNEHLEKTIYLEKIDDVTPPVDPETKPVTPPITPETKPTNPTVVNPKKDSAILTLEFRDSKTGRILPNKHIVINNRGTFTTNSNGELRNYPIHTGKQIMTFSSEGYQNASISLNTKIGENIKKTVYLENLSDVIKPVNPPVDPEIKPVTPPITPETKPTKPTVVNPEKEGAFLTLKFIDANTDKVLQNEYIGINGVYMFLTDEDGLLENMKITSEKLIMRDINGVLKEFPISLGKQILTISVQGYKDKSISLDLTPNEHLEKTIYLEKIDDVTPPVDPDIKPVTPPITPETKPTKPPVVNPEEEFALLSLKLIDADTNKPLVNKDITLSYIDQLSSHLTTNQYGELIAVPLIPGQDTIKISSPSYESQYLDVSAQPGEHLQKVILLKKLSDVIKPINPEIKPPVNPPVDPETKPVIPPITPETKPTKPTVVNPKKEFGLLTLKFLDAKTGNVLPNKSIGINGLYAFKTNSNGELIKIPILAEKLYFPNIDGTVKEFPISLGKQTVTISLEGYKNTSLSLDIEADESITKTVYLEKIDDVTPPVDPETKPVTPPITPETKPTKPTVVNPKKDSAILTLQFVDSKTGKVLSNKNIVINNRGTFTTDSNGELKNYPIHTGKQIMTFSSEGYQNASISLNTTIGEHIKKTVYLENLSDVIKPVNPEVKPPVNPEVEPPINPCVKPPINPEVKPPVNPEVKPPVNPEVKPPVNPEVKPPVNPEVKPPVNPEVKPQVNP